MPRKRGKQSNAKAAVNAPAAVNSSTAIADNDNSAADNQFGFVANEVSATVPVQSSSVTNSQVAGSVAINERPPRRQSARLMAAAALAQRVRANNLAVANIRRTDVARSVARNAVAERSSAARTPSVTTNLATHSSNTTGHRTTNMAAPSTINRTANRNGVYGMGGSVSVSVHHDVFPIMRFNINRPRNFAQSLVHINNAMNAFRFPSNLSENMLMGYVGGNSMVVQNQKNYGKINIKQSDVNNELRCMICLEYFGLPEQAMQLNCGHKFHDVCIAEWFRLHGTCPICRAHILNRGFNFFGIPDDPNGPNGRRDYNGGNDNGNGNGNGNNQQPLPIVS